MVEVGRGFFYALSENDGHFQCQQVENSAAFPGCQCSWHSPSTVLEMAKLVAVLQLSCLHYENNEAHSPQMCVEAQLKCEKLMIFIDGNC